MDKMQFYLTTKKSASTVNRFSRTIKDLLDKNGNVLSFPVFQSEYSLQKNYLSSLLSSYLCYSRRLLPPGGGGLLGISSDGDDRRTFLGLKFSIPGLFWARKFDKYFLGV